MSIQDDENYLNEKNLQRVNLLANVSMQMFSSPRMQPEVTLEYCCNIAELLVRECEKRVREWDYEKE